MTGRQRVLAAIAHQEPDRVAVDLGATLSSGTSALGRRPIFLDAARAATRRSRTSPEQAIRLRQKAASKAAQACRP